MSELESLAASIRAFAVERDWEKFHSPKNLSMALLVEAAELAEHFQWLTEEQSGALPESSREEVAMEIADVMIYLLRLADRLGIDVHEAARRKLEINARKYPAEKVRGDARKYSAYDD